MTKNTKGDQEKHEKHEKHKKHADAGYVDGIGGIGGSSGAGGVSAKPDHIGEVSGIAAESTDDIPMPGSTGKSEGGARKGQGGGGLSEKTKSAQTSETAPSQEGGGDD